MSENLGVVRESAGTVYLWPDKAAKRRQPPLVLRLVVVRGPRHAWFLVTSVRDRQRLSDRQVAEIHRRRWGVEAYFRHFKQTFGRGKLRSHKAEHAACELEWSLLGLWAMLLFAHAQQVCCSSIGYTAGRVFQVPIFVRLISLTPPLPLLILFFRDDCANCMCNTEKFLKKVVAILMSPP